MPQQSRIYEALKFMAAGLTGIFVNGGFLFFLTEGFGVYFMLSSLVGREASILPNYILNDL